MHVYRGFGPHLGKVMEGDADAFAYACTECGVMPIGDWSTVDAAFERAMLDWFYSGAWTVEKR